MRKLLPAAIAGLVCLLCAGAAFAVTLNGTDRGENLFGTTRADTINGKGGLDTIFGLSGNDTPARWRRRRHHPRRLDLPRRLEEPRPLQPDARNRDRQGLRRGR